MSRTALCLLILTCLCLAVLWLGPELGAVPSLLLKCASGLFGLATLVALLAGRRIKFDPQLR